MWWYVAAGVSIWIGLSLLFGAGMVWAGERRERRKFRCIEGGGLGSREPREDHGLRLVR